MTRISPIRHLHARWWALEAARTARVAADARPGAATGRRLSADDVEYLPYGPGDVAIEVPAAFGPVELEYAALRRGAVVMDLPQRAIVRVSGDDRVDFLDRLTTQALADLAPGQVRSTFLITRQGRVVADLLAVATDDAVLLEVDAHQAEVTAKTLESFVFTEDVTIENAEASTHRLSVIGRRAPEVLSVLAPGVPLASGDAVEVELVTAAGPVRAVVARHDAVGEPGFELIVQPQDAEAVAAALLDVELDAPVRACGWFAWNIARVEHGAPWFNIDFGTSSLPNETGVLRDRVSFNKGCYPGQEIVARLENLGEPKHVVVCLQVRGDVLPVEGSPVHAMEAEDAIGPPVGTVTSSTLSPMLGRLPIAIATVKGTHAKIGASVLVSAEGEMVEAVVAPRPLWVREEAKRG